jgi:hypothetical protein
MAIRWSGLALLGLAAAAMAQPPALPATVPAATDTAVARFAWRGDGPLPATVTVVPAVTTLGEVIAVLVDLPAGAVAPPPDSLTVDVPWLEPAPDVTYTLPPEAGESAGARVVAPFRVYRLGPWRPAWLDGGAGPVLEVAGRLEDPGQIVPVRDPRELGGIPRGLVLLAMALAAAALLLLGWWRWRRRATGDEVADRPLPPPAWLPAARDLWALEETRGHDRAYLDGLAAVLRRFVHGRFHLPAEEMTAAEIEAAAERAGWPAVRLRAYARLLAGWDAARYAPGQVTALACRDGMQRSLDLIDTERVKPRWTAVPADLQAEAAAAWRQLRERYPATERGESAC